MIGAGHLGRYHLQKLDASADAVIGTIVDPNERHLKAAIDSFGVRGHPSLDAAITATACEDYDAAIIASPTNTHFDLAQHCLELGLHLLIEKPLCDTAAHAWALTKRAQELGLVLQVGHVERFNPAVEAAIELLRNNTPRYISAERLSPFSGRSLDIDVLADLMIHDLDIVSTLVDSEISEIRAVGVPVITDSVDMCSARLEFANGAVAELRAGRASVQTSRALRLFSSNRYVSVDCAAGTVKSLRKLPAASSDGACEIMGEPVQLEPRDALAAQTEHFLACIREKKRPRVDGAAGVRAVAMVEAIRKVVERTEIS